MMGLQIALPFPGHGPKARDNVLRLNWGYENDRILIKHFYLTRDKHFAARQKEC